MSEQNNTGKAPEQLNIEKYANNNKDPQYEQYLKDKANFDAYMTIKNTKKEGEDLGFSDLNSIDKIKEQTKKEIEKKYAQEHEFNNLLSQPKSSKNLWEIDTDIINEIKKRYADNHEKGVNALKFQKTFSFMNKFENQTYISEEDKALWGEWEQLTDKQKEQNFIKFYPLVSKAEDFKKFEDKKNAESFMGSGRISKGGLNSEFYNKHNIWSR
jgi:hypothetical protein